MEELTPEELELLTLLKVVDAVADADSDCCFPKRGGGADVATSDAATTGTAALRAFAASESRLTMFGRVDTAAESAFFGMSDMRYRALPDIIRHLWRMVEPVQSNP